MIRWCAYCQRYQGEVEPFADYSMTHTICARCLKRGVHLRAQPARLEQIRAFFSRLARKNGDRENAAPEVLAEGRRLGLEPFDLLVGIVQPVLRLIGDRWAAGKASMRDEQRVSELCSLVIQHIVERDRSLAVFRQARAPAVLLMPAPGNQHTLGVRILEVFLLERHVPTFTIGRACSEVETLDLVDRLEPRAVAMSAAMADQLGSVSRVAERLAELPEARRPVVMVGGLAASVADESQMSGAVTVCRDLDALVSRAAPPRPDV